MILDSGLLFFGPPCRCTRYRDNHFRIYSLLTLYRVAQKK